MDPLDTSDPVERRSRGRNPDWSREETVLLMDLYLSAPDASERHPEVVALSLVLRAAARHEGKAMLPSFRNPAGVAMRLRNFGKLDPDVSPNKNPGIRPGGATDRLVWNEFGTQRAALALEVDRVRRSMACGDLIIAKQSSRGPAPHFGSFPVVTSDGRNWVYLLLIDGPLETLAPQATALEGYRIVKLGRTVDLERRVVELSSGLPPTCQIRYVPIGLRAFADGDQAHRFERSLLDTCDREGWSLGGEFAYAPLDRLRAALSMPNQE